MFDDVLGTNPRMAISALPMMGVGEVTHTLSPWEQFQGWLDQSGVLGKTMPDGTKMQGWGGLGLSAASGLMQGWMGMKQYGLMKDQLEQSKRAFNLNYDAQVKTTNARLNDQASARYASNPNVYQSPSEYMKKYGIGQGS